MSTLIERLPCWLHTPMLTSGPCWYFSGGEDDTHVRTASLTVTLNNFLRLWIKCKWHCKLHLYQMFSFVTKRTRYFSSEGVYAGSMDCTLHSTTLY